MASTAVTDTDGLKVKLTDGFQENLQKLEAVILSGPIWKVLRSVFLSHSHVISHEPDYLFTLWSLWSKISTLATGAQQISTERPHCEDYVF